MLERISTAYNIYRWNTDIRKWQYWDFGSLWWMNSAVYLEEYVFPHKHHEIIYYIDTWCEPDENLI
jgi:hypothetical protein